MGSGTTLVEAIVHGRRAYSTDINPVAVLITKVKPLP
jgi:DNA modification methylase